MDLAEFLLARIAEDEAVARAAYYDGQRWYAEEEIIDRWPECDCGTPVMSANRKAEAQFVADWQPSRVLAECDVKRRIVEHCIDYSDPYETELVVLLLALPYADHPDYDESWRP